MAKKETVKRKRVVFTHRAKPGCQVLVAGTFNDWDVSSKNVKTLVDKTGTGEFSKILMLPIGEYEYKFFVDGEWVADEKADWTHNDMGTLNSRVIVS